MTMSAPLARATSTGRLSTEPPSVKSLAVDDDGDEDAGDGHGGAHGLAEGAVVEDVHFCRWSCWWRRSGREWGGR